MNLHPLALELMQALVVKGGVATVPKARLPYFISEIRKERDPLEVAAHILAVAKRFAERSQATANHLFAIVVLAIGIKDATAAVERAPPKTEVARTEMTTMDKPRIALSMRKQRRPQ